MNFFEVVTRVSIVQHSNYKFIFLAVIAAASFGSVAAFARYAQMPAEHITFYRLFLGAFFMLIYMLTMRKGEKIVHKPKARTVVNGLTLAGFMFFYIQAMNYTDMANVIMIIYLAPLVCAVYAHFFFNEKLRIENIVVIATALFGFCMMMEFTLDFSDREDEIYGILYSLLSLVAYSAFMLLNRKPSSDSPYQSTLVQLSVGALCILPFVLNTPQVPSLDQTFWLIAIGLISGFFATMCAVQALRNLPSVTYGTLAYVEAIVVVGLGWVLFSESLNALQISGCIFIILSGMTQGYLSQRQQVSTNPKLKVIVES